MFFTSYQCNEVLILLENDSSFIYIFRQHTRMEGAFLSYKMGHALIVLKRNEASSFQLLKCDHDIIELFTLNAKHQTYFFIFSAISWVSFPMRARKRI